MISLLAFGVYIRGDTMSFDSDQRCHDSMVTFHSTMAALYNQDDASLRHAVVLLHDLGARDRRAPRCWLRGREASSFPAPRLPYHHGQPQEDSLNKAVSKLQHLGCSVEGLVMDPASDDSIRQGAQFVLSKFGRLDVLVNNASVSSSGAATRDQWLSVFNTNVFGVHSVTEAFLPFWTRQRPSRG